MACGVCEHCQSPVSRGDTVSIRKGYSYHKNCDKCYVCSETNLKNAEIFKGVIFCSSCSQRIFQGCSTARQTKDTRPKRTSSRLARKPRRSPKTNRERLTGVIELTGLVGSVGSDSKSLSDEPNRIRKIEKPLATDLSLQVGKEMCFIDHMKKESVEMGTTTNVTQALLNQIQFTEIIKPPPVPKYVYKHRSVKPNYVKCSDLRIAELGASTEIAHMALRKKSEKPFIIKSESRLHHEESNSLYLLKQESDISSDVNQGSTDSAYNTLQDNSTRPLMDRRIGSILKMPYKCFKKSILNRSSLISVLMWSSRSSEQRTVSMSKNLKILLQDEITNHQQRGMKRLYSTINRRKAQHKMGWLNLKLKMSQIVEPCKSEQQPKRCKHFRRSHSYRCMRAKVMRLAGPTKSELAEFREKIKDAIAPSFIKNLVAYNKRYAIMISKACGSDAHNAESIKKHLQILVK